MRYLVCLVAALAACGGGATVRDAAVVDTRAATDTTAVVDSTLPAEAGADAGADVAPARDGGDAAAVDTATEAGACPDNDGDGHIAQGCCVGTGDARTCGDDCNNNDPLIYPGAPEICDGIDEDCDGWADQSLPGTNGQTSPESDVDPWCVAHAPNGISANAPFDLAPPRCFSLHDLASPYQPSPTGVALFCEACRPCTVMPSNPNCISGFDCFCWDSAGRSWDCRSGSP